MKRALLLLAIMLATLEIAVSCGPGGGGTEGGSIKFCGMSLPAAPADCPGIGDSSACSCSIVANEAIFSGSCKGDTCQCSVQDGSGGLGPVMDLCTCTRLDVTSCAVGANCCLTTP